MRSHSGGGVRSSSRSLSSRAGVLSGTSPVSPNNPQRSSPASPTKNHPDYLQHQHHHQQQQSTNQYNNPPPHQRVPLLPHQRRNTTSERTSTTTPTPTTTTTKQTRLSPRTSSTGTNKGATNNAATTNSSNNVYATIVRQLDSSPSAVRKSFMHRNSHQNRHHNPDPITEKLSAEFSPNILATDANPSLNSQFAHYEAPTQRNGFIRVVSPPPTLITDIDAIDSTFDSGLTTTTDQAVERLQSSSANTTDYSTLQYSSPLKSKRNSKRYSMDVQDFIHRPSASSGSSESSTQETISSSGRRANSTSFDGNQEGGSGGYFSSIHSMDHPQYLGLNTTLDTTTDQTTHNQTTGSTNDSTSSRQCDKYGFFIDENANVQGLCIEREPDKIVSPTERKCLREREAKWLQMLNNWKYYINFKWDKLRDRCRKGIPHSLRSQAWFYLCGGHLQKRRNPRKYGELLQQKLPEDVRSEIQKDLHRQFPSHEMFAERGGTGQADLFNVLKAFAAFKPKIGYCQAQAPIAAVLLMHMPAEHAFWSLVSLNDYYIGGYFKHNLEEIQIQGQMLFAFLKKFSPSAHSLLKRQNIDPILYMTEWFMCIYSRSLKWASVLRVWDMFLCEGVSVLFKVGIYLVDVALRGENTKSCPSMYETCQKLRQIPETFLKEENLIKGVKAIALRDTDVVREHKIQTKRFRKIKPTEER